MTRSAKTKTIKPSPAAELAKEQASKLLELHIAHELEALAPETFVAWLRPELEIQLEQVTALSLDQFVNAEEVKQVIVRNVVDNEIPGAIAELAGEGATRLFSSDMHKNTALNEIVATEQFSEFIDKLLELPQQRKDGINHLIELPIYQDLISGVLYQAILRYIYEENILSKNVPGVASMLKFGKRMIDKSAPKLEGAVEDSVRTYIASNLVFLLQESKEFLENSLTEEDIKVSAMELWDAIEGKTMSEFQQGMDSIDLSEFVVLGYEFWKSFRKSAYFKDSYELIVDYFFEVYGSSPLSVLLDDFEISSTQIMNEVEAFAPKVLNTLKESGQIEGFLRRRLEGFYFSKPALNCLNK